VRKQRKPMNRFSRNEYTMWILCAFPPVFKKCTLEQPLPLFAARKVICRTI
jgi:hypothetical protein